MTLDLILPYYGMKRKPAGPVDHDRAPDAESNESIDLADLDLTLTLFD